MYNCYTVTKSTIKVTIVNVGNTPIGIAITPTAATGGLSSFDQAKETPMSHTKVISPAGTQNRAMISHSLNVAYSLAMNNTFNTSLEN